MLVVFHYKIVDEIFRPDNLGAWVAKMFLFYILIVLQMIALRLLAYYWLF